MLIKLKEKYGENLKLIMFGDLNITREKIHKKIEDKVSKYGFEILYKLNKEEFTREANRKGKNVRSYLDYFIIHGIKDYFFNIIDTEWQSDHKGLEFNFKQERENKFKTIKQVIQPYQIGKKDWKKIKEGLKRCLLSKGNVRLNLNKLIGEIDKKYKPMTREKYWN